MAEPDRGPSEAMLAAEGVENSAYELLWSLFGKLRGIDSPVRRDLILTAIYLLADGVIGQRLVEAAEGRNYAAVAEMFAGIWQDVPTTPEWTHSIRGEDRLGHPLRVAAIEIVLGLDEVLGHARSASDEALTAGAFSWMVERFADY